MQLLLTLVVAILAALGGRFLGARLHAPTPAVEERAEPAGLAELRTSVLRAEARVAELRRAADAPRLAPALADVAPDDEQLAAALARWHAAHPEAERTLDAARGASVPELASGEGDLAAMPIQVLARELMKAGFGNEARQAVFQKLRDLGRIDEYLAEIQRLAAEDPQDPALQVALGHAYLQKLFGMGGASPEVGAIAMKSDQAFDRALELDETNWDARFSKAVALSNWPAFLGRGAEAIDEFETLIDQQESEPPQAHFAYPYLFLGNMYQASGERPKAIATWKEGLRNYPEDPGLLAALKAAGL